MNNLIEKYTSNEENKLVVLETEDDRTNFINEIDNEVFIEMINNLVDNFATIKDQYAYNYNSFLNGEDTKLDKYYSTSFVENEYNNTRITNQNKKFLNKIKEYLDKNETAIIVLDVDHVFGDYGVMYQLGDKYEISIER